MPINGDAICNGAQETTYVNATTRMFRFVPSFLTNTIILFVSWDWMKSDFTFLWRLFQMCRNFKQTNCKLARHPLLINEVDYECKGIKTKYEHLKSNVIMDVAHCAMEGNRYNSIVLTNILGVCYWTSCLQDGNFNLSHCCITRHGNHEFFTIGISMYPLAMNRTKISMNHCWFRSLGL